MQTLTTILIYAGIVQGFYIAFLLNHNNLRNVANHYLAILLVVMSISIAHAIFVVPEIYKTLNYPFRIREPFLMLVIPLIWLYVKKLERSSFRFSAQTTFHFLPFVVFMSVNIPAFLHGSASVPAQFLSEYSGLFNGAIWTAILVQYAFYLFRIVRLTRSYKMQAEQELSNIEHVDLSWLNTFLYVFVVVLALLAIMFVSDVHHLETAWMDQSVSLVLSLTIFVLGYKGLFQQSIFSNTSSIEVIVPAEPEFTKQKPIDGAQKEHLLTFMDLRKPYLDSELTLTSLAKQVNMNRNQLSEVINNSMGCNFYDFVNKYRVEEVKQLLTLPSNKDFTLLAIAFDAGFPSKSTFNSIFKKFTGLTPSEYKAGLS